eukprot:TRINITY_DN11852_c4_g1_i2.p1 TRINITY_DN11852_c4_g1~~TRINITY_DN11852_c4_g1_i2.p1  ORF type:complete len:106 (+),score=24.88 TRINITY_DN11852_c4_g1_i2:638-955(+)
MLLFSPPLFGLFLQDYMEDYEVMVPFQSLEALDCNPAEKGQKEGERKAAFRTASSMNTSVKSQGYLHGDRCGWATVAFLYYIISWSACICPSSFEERKNPTNVHH